ncbi:MAG: hypothetical protein RPS47_04405 [Colwellia sp.]|jgi:hypothetical protein
MSQVQGLERFSTYFTEYKDRYTLIGGVACYLNLADADIDFRATKDLDIVLSAEALDAEFAQKFWDFVKEGGYQHQEKSTGKKQFYRFSKPERADFPFMLELFSKQPEAVFLKYDGNLTPIPIEDDVASLSAILLDEDYYQCIKDGGIELEGLPVLTPAYLVPFKMRAFCDLSARKEKGEEIDSRNINKHKNDVLKISQVLSPTEHIPVVEVIKQHMREFITKIKNEKINMKNLGLTGIELADVIDLWQEVYELNLEPEV